MPSSAPQFVFMTCRPGAEQALKQEVADREPDWRFAFSRPGFLTFKHTADPPLDAQKLAERHWTFAHVHGLSLGRVSGEQLGPLVDQVWNHEGVAALATQATALGDIHVWQREPLGTADDAREAESVSAIGSTPLALEIDHALRAAAPALFTRLKKSLPSAPPSRRRHASPHGGFVLDVFVLEPGEWWIGYHRAVTPVERWPGGHIPVALPEHAVSRAYAKMEEALKWSALPVAAGDECVEIGCAPGGASQALLDRGMFVTGIDPAEVDPAVLSHPRFRHLKKRGKEVRRREFIGVRWLAADMNIAPEATLDEVEPIVTHEGVTIRGLVLTLKLSDWSVASRLDGLAKRVRGWGYRDVRLRQLVTGGQEVCLVALRRKALRRLGRKANQKAGTRPPNQRRLAESTPPLDHANPGEAPLAAGGTMENRRDAPQIQLSGPHY